MKVQKKEQVIAFLNTKIENREEDPDERWITTWNDYLWRIKYFFRWLYNIKKTNNNDNIISSEPSNWTTPIFMEIKKIKTKRLSRYLESELWEKDEIISRRTNTALVEYFMTRDRVYIFVIMANKFHVKESNIPAKMLLDYLEVFERDITNYPYRKFTEQMVRTF